MNYEDLYYVCLCRVVLVNISLSHKKLTISLYKHSVNYCIRLVEVRRYRSIVVRLGLSLLLAKLHYCVVVESSGRAFCNPWGECKVYRLLARLFGAGEIREWQEKFGFRGRIRRKINESLDSKDFFWIEM